MKKEKLKKYLESIKKITEQESKLDDVLREISPDFGGYSNELAIDTLLNMMKDLAKDESEWIDYFIFELDWGKSYKDGMVTDENGKTVSNGSGTVKFDVPIDKLLYFKKVN